MLERVRVEVYIPDNSAAAYQKLLNSFEEEFTYAFGGSSILRGLQGSYLSRTGQLISDRVNLVYSDVPFALSTDFVLVASYAGVLKRVAMEALSEEAVLVSVEQVYHAV
jgi:hypothetical protein